MKTQTKITFHSPHESMRWLAKMNEQRFCYEAAIRLYNEIGDCESVTRCQRMMEILQPKHAKD